MTVTSHLDHPSGFRATGADSRPPERMPVVALPLDAPADDVALDGCGAALVIAFDAGRPVGEAIVHVGEAAPTPDRAGFDGESLRRRVLEALRPAVAAGRAEASLWRAVGGEWWAALPLPPTTVAVCTRDRHGHLAHCLEALRALDPAPERVLVIDNASRRPCRELVESFGFDCVEEPRPGLNNARRRALAECRTELIVYTDDDCLPHPAWLAGLGRHFADPLVAVTSGLGCPLTLGSDAQAAFEATAGFTKGYRMRRVDWRALAPISAGNVGAGNNMAFRAQVLRSVDGFPRELDAGTPTASGGDLYVFARVLAAGWRMVYDPAQLIWHDHRADLPELRRVMRGYGRGFGAMLGRSLIGDGEVTAVRASAWPLRQVAADLAALRRGRRARVSLVGSLELLRGWVESPATWRASLRREGESVRRPADAVPAPPSPAPIAPGPPIAPRAARTTSPALTVVVPTMGTRPASLTRTLDALDNQTLDRGRYEILLVPNGPDAPHVPPHPAVDEVLPRERPSLGEARNAGAGMARGDLVVFCDDDVVPAPEGLAVFLDAARLEPAVLLGAYRPASLGSTLAEQVAGRWWHDHFTRQARPGHRFTFTDMAGGWMGLPRSVLERSGGFDSAFDGRTRREDWELSLRLLADGVAYVALPDAVATHHHVITPMRLLRDKVAEGHADVLLASRHPAVHADLHLARLATAEQVAARPWPAIVATGRAVVGRSAPAAEGLLASLERTHARFAWLATFRRLSAACYCAGVQAALDDGNPLPQAPSRTTTVSIDSPLPPHLGAALGPVDLRLADRTVARVRLPDGQWDAEALAEGLRGADYPEEVSRALGLEGPGG